MFPHLRKRLGPRLLDRLDLLVELSTLGEYRLAHDTSAAAFVPRSRGDCAPTAGASARLRDRGAPTGP